MIPEHVPSMWQRIERLARDSPIVQKYVYIFQQGRFSKEQCLMGMVIDLEETRQRLVNALEESKSKEAPLDFKR
jgi:hypothetical protein